jgi:gamma-glutamyltranspeptidase/glutathione hydrolase
MSNILSPAIDLATNGFPVSPITSYFWQSAAKHQLKTAINGNQMLLRGKAPVPGQIFKNIGLAKTLSLIAGQGKEAFLPGRNCICDRGCY